MALIKIETEIKADIKVCFDLARNIDFHQDSLKHSQEKAIAGKVAGLIELGEWVSWEAKHLGFVQHLTSKITEFDAPHYFVDEMVFGAFKSFRHEHIFRTSTALSINSSENKTIMIDKFYFESPYGPIGKLINVLFLKRYMKNLLKTRNRVLKLKAESL